VAIVMLRLPASRDSSSSSVSTICARWLMPTFDSALAGPQQAAQALGRRDALLDEVEYDFLRRADPVHPADDLPDGEAGQLSVVRAGDAACHFAVQDSLQWHGQRLRGVVALPRVGPCGAQLPRGLTRHRARPHGAARVGRKDVLLRLFG